MKKSQSLYLVFIVAISFLNFSCSVSSSQIGAFTYSNPQPKMQNYYWDANYDNLNYRLIAMELPNGTLFADKFGNSLFFDGWSIVSIVGFGDFEGEYDIQGDEVGSVELNDEDAYSIQKNCGEWEENLQDNFLIFKQSCVSEVRYINKIIVNDADEIIAIHQYIEPQNKLMVLKKSMSTK